MTFAVGAKVLMVQNARIVRFKTVKSVNLVNLKFVHIALQVMFGVVNNVYCKVDQLKLIFTCCLLKDTLQLPIN